MNVTIFKTPGQLDLTAITTFGVNAKPNTTSPIGYFGTGLKYAIAVLLRANIKVELYRGKRRYSFRVVPDEFRDKKFNFIEMVEESKFLKPAQRLPFTTELGKNWELWQAFRELYSNTLDEDLGTATLLDVEQRIEFEENTTVILVYGDDFAEQYRLRDRNFLPGGIRQKSDNNVQYFMKPSKHVYYRGLRVIDLQHESLVTWNVLTGIDLTEDRTAKYPWQVQEVIKNYVAQSKDEDLIRTVISAPEKTYEKGFDFNNTWFAPSDVFIDIVNDARAYYVPTINHSALRYARNHNPAYKAQELTKHFTQRLSEAIEEKDWDKFLILSRENDEELYKLLRSCIPVDGTVVNSAQYVGMFTENEEPLGGAANDHGPSIAIEPGS